MADDSGIDVDVLIVGAGPAGCIAGILLAREGIQATILEKNPPGHRKVCGDLLGSRSLQFLDGLKIDWTTKQAEGLPIEGIQVFDEKCLKSVAYLEKKPGKDPVGITLRRDRLDGYLQEKAEASGCNLLHGVKFREFLGREETALLCRASAEGADHLGVTGVTPFFDIHVPAFQLQWCVWDHGIDGRHI